MIVRLLPRAKMASISASPHRPIAHRHRHGAIQPPRLAVTVQPIRQDGVKYDDLRPVS